MSMDESFDIFLITLSEIVLTRPLFFSGTEFDGINASAMRRQNSMHSTHTPTSRKKSLIHVHITLERYDSDEHYDYRKKTKRSICFQTLFICASSDLSVWSSLIKIFLD